MTSGLGILSVNETGLRSVIETLQELSEQDGVEAVAELWLGPSGAERCVQLALQYHLLLMNFDIHPASIRQSRNGKRMISNKRAMTPRD